MIILNQTELNSIESPIGVYNIEEDYTLNGGTLPIPNGKTLKFIGGTINNGTLQFNNNLLQDLTDGSINARITGTVQNTTLYTKQISGINNLGLSNYSGKTIFCDQDENNVSVGIFINGANTNGSTNTVFDGQNHNFTCSNTFFTIGYGSRNVTIKNFHATALSSAGYIDFEKMNSSVGVKNITVTENIISGFSVGISINGDDTNNSYVDDCEVVDNTILNARGTEGGQGYGIHLANARNCLIMGNTIENSDRHSIYHAYGDHNSIIGNTIRNHRINHATPSELAPRSAIEVLRKSTNLSIIGNVISNCYNVGILVYAFPPSHETTDPTKYFKYGCIENITIQGNYFTISGISGDLGGLMPIMIGYIYDSSVQYSEFVNYHVNDVKIKNNIFQKTNTEALGCIRIDQCLAPSIFNNTFKFYTPSSGHTKTLIVIKDRFKNDENMELNIYNNTFNALYPTNNYTLYCIGDLNSVNNSAFDITVSNNTLSNQYSGGNPNYKLYQPVGITSTAGSNLHLQAET